MSKYKVGDKALIKDKRWIDSIRSLPNSRISTSRHTGFHFNEDMEKLCGKWVTIASVDAGRNPIKYSIEEDGGSWDWTDLMFQEPLYKVGDKVTIRSEEWYRVAKSEAGYIQTPRKTGINPRMTGYLGRTATITEIFGKHNVYHLDVDDGEWAWEDFLFEDSDPLEKILKESALCQGSKYKVGDTVIIKSIYWYEANKNENDEIISKNESTVFTPAMKKYCSEEMVIGSILMPGVYSMEGSLYSFAEDFIDSSSEENKRFYDKFY